MQNLLLLACPVGMGVMMWVMSRGTRDGGSDPKPSAGSIEDLRDEHRKLGEDLARLEGERAEEKVHTVA